MQSRETCKDYKETARLKRKATSIVYLTISINFVLSSQELERNIALCSQKLLRAEKLISGLGGERSRWTQVSTKTT